MFVPAPGFTRPWYSKQHATASCLRHVFTCFKSITRVVYTTEPTLSIPYAVRLESQLQYMLVSVVWSVLLHALGVFWHLGQSQLTATPNQASSTSDGRPSQHVQGLKLQPTQTTRLVPSVSSLSL